MDKPFQPLEIPEEAYYRGRAIVGVEGSVGNVLNAAIWVGTISAKGWSGIMLTIMVIIATLQKIRLTGIL